jgi:hypothetical protein
MQAIGLHRMLLHQGNPTMSNISAVFAAVKRQLKVGELARGLKLRCYIFVLIGSNNYCHVQFLVKFDLIRIISRLLEVICQYLTSWDQNEY